MGSIRLISRPASNLSNTLQRSAGSAYDTVMSRVAAFFRTYPQIAAGGVALMRAAPAIALLAAVPEFLQHIVEIQLGMFASPAAFKALAADPLRMQFGAVKLIGFTAALFAAALFFANRITPWRRISRETRPRLWLALALNLATIAAAVWIPQLQAPVPQAIVSLATAPLLIYFAGALFGDRTMDLRAAYTRGWLILARMAAFILPFFVGGQLLHRFNHTLALGQPPAVVWVLMAWDALWLAVMACWVGAALGLGYGRASDEAPPARDQG